MFVALIVYLMVTDAGEQPPEWALALISVGICLIPRKVLDALTPAPLRHWPESSRPGTIQAPAGDTWITHVPTIRTPHAERTTIRLPFRVLSAVGALLGMFGAIVTGGEVPLLMRILMFLFGGVFGGFALVPDGDLTRMFPRISTGPRLPAGSGDADAD
jgi:hypothetical protein